MIELSSKFLKNFYSRLVEEGLEKEYEIIGQKTSTVVLRHSCGYEFSVRESDFFEKDCKCFKCEVKKMTNDEYEIINFSTAGNRSTYTFLHKTCGKSFKITRKLFRDKNGKELCPHCFHARGVKHTIEELKERVKNMTNGDYEILSDSYKAITDKLLFLHKSCGRTFEASPAHFLHDGTRCPVCAWNNRKRTTEDFLATLKRYTGDEIEIVSNYKDWNTEMEFRHTKCGNTFKRLPKDMIKNCRENFGAFCPYCSVMSIGEREIKKYLDASNVPYIYNRSIEGCKMISPLRFDFIIYENEKKDKIKYLLEFDGPQHFDVRRDFGSPEEHEETLKRDATKNKFCEENDLKLIRINYKDEHLIKEILESYKII